jgi:hypothetical protein
MSDNTSGGDKGMAAIGELICRLNPYTNQAWNDLTQLKTGEMQVCMLPHALGAPVTLDPADRAKYAELHKQKTDGALPEQNKKQYADLASKVALSELNEIGQISIEVERNYGTQWTFKGQVQHVRSAFRIPYRFPVQDKDNKTLYWQTEYLLIGYAGGDGGA